jgi:hypothetical protein
MAAILAPGPYNPADNAAVGPNYGVGFVWHPNWQYDTTRPGETVQVPANYGSHGGMVGYFDRTLDIIGKPSEPTSLLHRPLWNQAPPTINWHLAVLTPQQLATFESATNQYPAQVPLNFTPAGNASLMK